jgi:hypothetical protein
VSSDASRSNTRAELVRRAYRKTPSGREEIATRAHRLANWLRCTLILIDGRRTPEEITTLISTPAELAIRELVNLGFIEPIDESESTTAPPPSTAPAPMLWRPVSQARRRALRCIDEVLGPEGAPLARRVLTADSADKLHHALVLTERYIRKELGGRRAEAFERYVGLRPPRA